MKKIILVTILFGILGFNLSAQTKREKITELFRLMKTETLMSSMLDNMTMAFRNTPSISNAHADSIYKAYVREETIAFSKRMFDKDMVDLYDKYFTPAEIQAYIDFYKTPAGQKMLDMGPAIQKDLMTGMMSNDMPQLQAKFKKKLEELQN